MIRMNELRVLENEGQKSSGCSRSLHVRTAVGTDCPYSTSESEARQ